MLTTLHAVCLGAMRTQWQCRPAGRIMLTRLKALAAARQDFAFESRLSSRSFAPLLHQLKAQGYQGDLLLLAVERFIGRASRQAAGGDGGMMRRLTRCVAALAEARTTSIRGTCHWPTVGRCLTTRSMARPY